jgi:hypothetical protein
MAFTLYGNKVLWFVTAELQQTTFYDGWYEQITCMAIINCIVMLINKFCYYLVPNLYMFKYDIMIKDT